MGNAVIPASGGMAKTMCLFREALGAELFSFTSPDVAKDEIEAFPDVNHLGTLKEPFCNWYAFAGKRSRSALEEAVQAADHISCHVMLRYHAVWAWRTALARGLPYWVIPHGQLDPYVFSYRKAIKVGWMRVYGRRILRDASHVIFATKREMEKAEWCHGGDNRRVIHWPVNLIPVEGKDSARKELCERLGIPASSKVIVFLGRLQRMKRPLETIAALAASGAGGVHLAVVGPEEDVTREQCHNVAVAAGVRDQVHVIGPVYGVEKEAFLQGADAYVSLSYRENFGHTAAESLAAGTPVILSPGNDLSLDLKPLGCGWFLESNDIDEAANAIREVSQASPDELVRRGMRGRGFVERECSFAGFRNQLLSLREEALALNGRERR